jgi:hypothetical protein
LFLVVPILIIILIFIAVLFLLDVSFRAEFVSWDIITWEIDERLEIWQNRFSHLWSEGSFYLFFGLGKSFSDESHNQFVRTLFEAGLIGSLIFFFLILAIFKKTVKSFLYQKDTLKIALSAGIIVSTLAMLIVSIPADAFSVVRISEVYWFFMGMTMAVLTLKTNESRDI